MNDKEGAEGETGAETADERARRAKDNNELAIAGVELLLQHFDGVALVVIDAQPTNDPTVIDAHTVSRMKGNVGMSCVARELRKMADHIDAELGKGKP